MSNMRQYAGSPERILKNASGDELAQLTHHVMNAPGIAEAERGVTISSDEGNIVIEHGHEIYIPAKEVSSASIGQRQR